MTALEGIRIEGVDLDIVYAKEIMKSSPIIINYTIVVQNITNRDRIDVDSLVTIIERELLSRENVELNDYRYNYIFNNLYITIEGIKFFNQLK